MSDGARRLRGERLDRRALGIDRRGEAAIPAHVYVAALVDLVDDTAVSGAQAGVVARSRDELDPGADRYARTNACRKEPGTVGIHETHIGFAGENLYPPTAPQAGSGGVPSQSTKSRVVGELLRNRRLRIGSPAYAVYE